MRAASARARREKLGALGGNNLLLFAAERQRSAAENNGIIMMANLLMSADMSLSGLLAFALALKRASAFAFCTFCALSVCF